ncbi:hypothetical protein MN116_004300 [Schistosoma mekongi]|uniref:Uncharacterized protein n=1 Tax=Schistosoma mekongi TaxID=38744 RepID=A0AAE1ZFX7_SCHME|nr:hypothetical protein MN116_004300 [Schistosoma mekongi]
MLNVQHRMKFNPENNTILSPEYNLTLSHDWSYFLKVHLQNYILKAFLIDITLEPRFKVHGEMKSIKHLRNCYESYRICQLQMIGYYQDENVFVHDKKNMNILRNDSSVRSMPSEEDCEKLCWAIRQPYLYRNGGLWICGKEYRILYADCNQTIMANEQDSTNAINLNTFTATRLRRPNEDYYNSKEKLQFIMLIGFHRQDCEQAKCNEVIMEMMDLLRKRLTPIDM